MTKKDIDMKSDMVRHGIEMEKEAEKLFDHDCPKCHQSIKVKVGLNKCPSCGQVINFEPKSK